MTAKKYWDFPAAAGRNWVILMLAIIKLKDDQQNTLSNFQSSNLSQGKWFLSPPVSDRWEELAFVEALKATKLIH